MISSMDLFFKRDWAGGAGPAVEPPRFRVAAVEVAGAAADVEGWKADVAAGLTPRPEKRELVGAGALVVAAPRLVAIAELAAGGAVDAAVVDATATCVVVVAEGCLPRLENKEDVGAALVIAGPAPAASVPPDWLWPILENGLLMGAADVVLGVLLAPSRLNEGLLGVACAPGAPELCVWKPNKFD